MPQFQYQATTPQGQLIEGVREAEEERAVVAWLHTQGYIPLNVALPHGREAKTARNWQLSLPDIPWRGRVTQRDVLLLTRELATMLSAGLPLDRALSALVGLASKPALSRVADDVLKTVQQGQSLADALAQYPTIFPPLYLNMVRAGEVGGFLETALQRLAEYLERAQEVQEEVKSALTYPVLLVLFGAGAIIFMFIFILPRFAGLFADSGQGLPASTRFMLATSEVLRSYWWGFLLAGAGGVFGGQRYVATPQGRLAWDGFRLRLPLLGSLLQKREVGRFFPDLKHLAEQRGAVAPGAGGGGGRCREQRYPSGRQGSPRRCPGRAGAGRPARPHRRLSVAGTPNDRGGRGNRPAGRYAEAGGRLL